MQNLSKLALALGLGLGAAATDARAHAFLDKALPPVGGTVSAAPTEIRLVFSEPIVAQFSGLSLTTTGGAPVATGKPTQPPGDKTVLIATITGALAPGANAPAIGAIRTVLSPGGWVGLPVATGAPPVVVKLKPLN